MKTIIILSIFIILITYVLTYNETCGNTTKKCKEGQTCCKSIIDESGWSCYPTKNGECCDNMKSCCPGNTKCSANNKCISNTI